MKWIKVTEALPEIPEGKHSVSVLVCEYDCVYDELHLKEIDKIVSNGKGLSVNKFVSYGKFKDITMEDDIEYFGFHEMVDEGWMHCCEQITHWCYLPEPPYYLAPWNEEKGKLEFVYVD